MTFVKSVLVSPGVSRWSNGTDSFDLRIIRNSAESHSGNEVFHLFATPTGSGPEDPHGHHMTIMAEGETEVDVAAQMHDDIQRYLAIQARACRQATSKACVADLFVESHDVSPDDLPRSLTHLAHQSSANGTVH